MYISAPTSLHYLRAKCCQKKKQQETKKKKKVVMIIMLTMIRLREMKIIKIIIYMVCPSVYVVLGGGE
jgi:hypothetical protein